MKKTAWLILRLCFGIGLLVYLLFFKFDPRTVFSALVHAKLGLVLLAFSLHAVGLWISAIRWKLILDEKGAAYTQFKLVQSYLVGTFFSHFLPTRFGGDIVRLADTRKIPEGASASLAVIVYERMSGIFILTAFALAASLAKIGLIRQVPIIYVSLGISVVLIIVFYLAWKRIPRGFFCRWARPGTRGSRMFGTLERIHSAMLDLLQNRRLLGRVLLWAFILQLNVVIHYFLLGRALQLDRIPLTDYFFIIPILLFFLSVPISINGLGIRDWLVVTVFRIYGLDGAPALAFSFYDLFFNLILGVIGGFVYLFRKRDRP